MYGNQSESACPSYLKPVGPSKAVPGEIQSTQQALTNMEEFLGQLICRLASVSRVNPPCPMDKAAQPCGSVELAQDILNIGNRIRTATTRIQEAIDLLEI